MPSNSGKPSQVVPGLWISGIQGIDEIQNLKLTHVVSVINGSPPPTAIPPKNHLHIDIEDDEDANILQHLPNAIKFIENALNGTDSDNNSDAQGKTPSLLVHCAQGTSRSAAIVIAYLMKQAQTQKQGDSNSLDPDAALAVLLKSHPSANPNSGFMKQLHLFHCMHCTLDMAGYAPYRRFAAQQAALQYQNTGILDASTWSTPSCSSSDETTLYRCRKCRILLATSDNILEKTSEGSGALYTSQAGSGFSWKKRGKTTVQQQQQEHHNGTESGGIFIEPLKWMSNAGVFDGAVQGKLYCPKCAARLGTFNWCGVQNNQGTWITPGFHLHLTRLDTEYPMKQAALAAQLGRVLLEDKISGTISDGQKQQQQLVVANTSEVPLKIGVHKKYLILDVDGVLVDSERPSCESLRRAILHVTGFDIPHDFPEDFRPVFGMDVYSCVEYYSTRFAKEHDWSKCGTETGVSLQQLADNVLGVKEGIYKDMTKEGVVAFPGVVELVSRARERGMKVAVASSGSPEKIMHNLHSSGILQAVNFERELLVSAKYVARGKPFPDVYIEALKRLGCDNAAEAVVVEDAVNGLKAAKAAGCFTIGVTTSLPREILLEFADVVVDRIEDISFLKNN